MTPPSPTNGKRTLVVIPTFNEAENIGRVIPAVFRQAEGIDLLIIDDNSPDGTSVLVREMMEKNSHIHLIERSGKMGLGSAYVEGFKFAVQQGYEFIFEMDADFSHDPNDIPRFLVAIQEADLVLGSRYINGIRILNWPMSRLLLSYGANIYTRFVTGLPLNDATGGFKCFRRSVLEAINLNDIRSNGYSFQIEMCYKTWKRGFRVREIPIVFLDRRHGSSKMSKQIASEAFFMVWKLRMNSLFHKL
jgi:dolichol-phosphate mannosyltransferase